MGSTEPCLNCGGERFWYYGNLVPCRCGHGTTLTYGSTVSYRFTSAGPTQLDRIEQKLDELLRILKQHA